MHRLRSVLLVIGTAIVFAVCAAMLGQVIGFSSPWLALLLMFYFMALAKLAEPFFMLPMPGALLRIRPWEQSGRLYRRLAVPQFGSVLRNTPLRYFNAQVYSSGADDLLSLHRRLLSVEATHFWAAVLFTPYIAFLFLRSQPGLSALFLLIQLLVNVYPILHLRSARSRLATLLKRQQARATRVCNTRLPEDDTSAC
ncbi:hypothetical protein ACHMW6_10440 [Pseudoduganella sp. UC29_106]|uniref:glycosyl-4,4'-diaponeurosporenoate acyltransferase CrtO family protein n=1 Tax=Pseudoduganella sp. UC29_106 TaxID=3374553 RepID=UPI003756596E